MRGEKRNNRALLQRYLAIEVKIEFKACLYFFCILFFYSVFRMVHGSFEASILHMAEMIFTTYAMGYIQMFFLANFDEGERFNGRTVAYSLLGAFLYTVVAVLGKWFEGNVIALGLFFGYMEICFLCAFCVYTVKREFDTKMLNDDLKIFQERKSEDGKCN